MRRSDFYVGQVVAVTSIDNVPYICRVSAVGRKYLYINLAIPDQGIETYRLVLSEMAVTGLHGLTISPIRY